jgi:hypothetical protein
MEVGDVAAASAVPAASSAATPQRATLTGLAMVDMPASPAMLVILLGACLAGVFVLTLLGALARSRSRHAPLG